MRASRLACFLLAGGVAAGGCAAHSTPSADAAVSSSNPHFVYDDPVSGSEPTPLISRSVDDDVYVPPAGATLAAETVAPSAAAIDVSIREVRDAVSVDAAVDAYAAGLAVDNASLALHKAYLRKVVDLDAPNLGVAAAQKVLAAEPNDGLARAVMAYSEAQQGSMVAALTDISIAAKRLPSDPFVQRTAGHLIAWYDNNPHPPTLPEGVRNSLPRVHDDLNKLPAYAEAYRDASGYFRDERDRVARGDGPATQPTTRPDYSGYSGADIGYSAVARPEPYSAPYTVNNYYYDAPYAYDYGWPYYYGWGPGLWWWPGFVFVDFDFHHHHFDHGRFGRFGDFDRGFRSRFFGDRHDSFGLARGGSFTGAGITPRGSFPRSITPGTARNFGSTGGAGFGRPGFSNQFHSSRSASPSIQRGGGGSFRGGGGFHGGGGMRGGGGGARSGGGGHR